MLFSSQRNTHHLWRNICDVLQCHIRMLVPFRRLERRPSFYYFFSKSERRLYFSKSWKAPYSVVMDAHIVRLSPPFGAILLWVDSNKSQRNKNGGLLSSRTSTFQSSEQPFFHGFCFQKVSLCLCDPWKRLRKSVQTNARGNPIACSGERVRMVWIDIAQEVYQNTSPAASGKLIRKPTYAYSSNRSVNGASSLCFRLWAEINAQSRKISSLDRWIFAEHTASKGFESLS